MADDALRLQHLTDAAFLSHFEQSYPQDAPWTLLHLAPATNSLLTSALLCKSPPSPLSPRPEKGATKSSASGSTSAHALEKPHASVASSAKNQSSATYWSLVSATDRPAKPVTLSGLTQWRTRSWRWARGWPTWVSPIPESLLADQRNTIPYSRR